MNGKKILALRLAGSQSWGTKSNFGHRDTEKSPTISGVVGVLGCAMGKPREETKSDGFPTWQELASCSIVVRIDHPGTVCGDFQTAHDVITSDEKGKKNVISWRYYLSDADFLVLIEGPANLIDRLSKAVSNPVWNIYLGRKSFPPLMPLNEGVIEDQTMDEVLNSHVWWKRDEDEDEHKNKTLPKFLTVIMSGEDGYICNDIPVDMASTQRKFMTRTVVEKSVELSTEIIKEL
jgi:CRISPR system Cascade subunit CasD